MIPTTCLQRCKALTLYNLRQRNATISAILLTNAPHAITNGIYFISELHNFISEYKNSKNLTIESVNGVQQRATRSTGHFGRNTRKMYNNNSNNSQQFWSY